MEYAYSISAPDCGVHYFENAPERLFCVNCDSYIGTEEFIPRLDMGFCRQDFCFTFENQLLVSTASKNWLEKNCKTSLDFDCVDRLSGFFVVRALSTVPFDTERRKTRFQRLCPNCGNFESVVGATPVFLIGTPKVEAMGAYRTDLCFGSGRGKSPVLIVGAELKRGLEAAFPELDFERVNSDVLQRIPPSGSGADH